MDIETLFTVSKWGILTHLAEGKFSPLELSKKLNTSIANISQQLRLLEFAGLVKKQKISQREAGKPRTLYFLANDFGYLVLLMKDCADKRLLALTEHHKIIMRIWLIEDVSKHYVLEKLYWKIEPVIEQAKCIVVDTKSPEPTVYVVTDSKDLEKKMQDVQVKTPSGETKTITVKVVLEREVGTAKLPLEKMTEFHIIHDPKGILTKKD
jgi:predicted transcriptional regulator